MHLLPDYSDISAGVCAFVMGQSGQIKTPPPIPSNEPTPIPLPVKQRPWWDVMLQAIVTAGLVGVMAGAGVLMAGNGFQWKPACGAFLVAFVVEMRRLLPLVTPKEWK